MTRTEAIDVLRSIWEEAEMEFGPSEGDNLADCLRALAGLTVEEVDDYFARLDAERRRVKEAQEAAYRAALPEIERQQREADEQQAAFERMDRRLRESPKIERLY